MIQIEKSKRKPVKAKSIRLQIAPGIGKDMVKVTFSGDGIYTPEEFISMDMALNETYAQILLKNNTKEQVFDFFNDAYGKLLAKILPEDKIYERDAAHKAFKALTDNTLGKKDSKELDDSKAMAQLAGVALATEILTKTGMSPDTVNVLITKSLRSLKSLKAPDVK